MKSKIQQTLEKSFVTKTGCYIGIIYAAYSVYVGIMPINTAIEIIIGAFICLGFARKSDKSKVAIQESTEATKTLTQVVKENQEVKVDLKDVIKELQK